MLLKEFLFPKFCLGCGKFGKFICATCSLQLSFLSSQTCIYCHKASYTGLTHARCSRQNGIDGFVAVFKYNNLLKKIIKTIKYRLATDILDELISLSANEIVEELKSFLDLGLPVFFQAIPLHRQRLRERGFNQAELIINKLGSRMKITTCDLLVRIKNTPPQAQITDKSERFNNLQGAFAVKPQIKQLSQRAFFLVDDVVTTGSTVQEAARSLKQHQAAKVYVFSLAKG